MKHKEIVKCDNYIDNLGDSKKCNGTICWDDDKEAFICDSCWALYR